MDKKTITIIFAVALAIFFTLFCVWSSKTKDTTSNPPAEEQTAPSALLNVTLLSADTSTEQSIKDKNAENVNKFAEKIQKEPFLFTLMCIFGVVALVTGTMLVAPKFIRKSY